MTSIATVVGALPLMFAYGAGSASRRTIGVVIVFGAHGVHPSPCSWCRRSTAPWPATRARPRRWRTNWRRRARSIRTRTPKNRPEASNVACAHDAPCLAPGFPHRGPAPRRTADSFRPASPRSAGGPALYSAAGRATAAARSAAVRAWRTRRAAAVPARRGAAPVRAQRLSCRFRASAAGSAQAVARRVARAPARPRWPGACSTAWAIAWWRPPTSTGWLARSTTRACAWICPPGAAVAGRAAGTGAAGAESAHPARRRKGNPHNVGASCAARRTFRAHGLIVAADAPLSCPGPPCSGPRAVPKVAYAQLAHGEDARQARRRHAVAATVPRDGEDPDARPLPRRSTLVFGRRARA